MGYPVKDLAGQVNGFVFQNPDPLENLITFRLFVAGEWVGWSGEGRQNGFVSPFFKMRSFVGAE